MNMQKLSKKFVRLAVCGVCLTLPLGCTTTLSAPCPLTIPAEWAVTSNEPRYYAGDGERDLLNNLNTAGEAERLARNRHNGLLNWIEKKQRECK